MTTILLTLLACIDPIVPGEATGSSFSGCVVYADRDGDGYGDAATPREVTCTAPLAPGWVEDAWDCDDWDRAVNPGSLELCGGTDENCDGLFDAEAEDARTWYVDVDGDGYGSEGVVACDRPAGGVDLGGDCDDHDATLNPEGDEVCDGRDNDCNGLPDDDAADSAPFHLDGDGDGYGDPTVVSWGCSAPAFHVDDASDCYDGSADAHPGQRGFFVEHRGDGSFDYDCDGLSNRERTALGACTDTCTLEREGWLDDAPTCGESGKLVTGCADIRGFCTAETTSDWQTCR